MQLSKTEQYVFFRHFGKKIPYTTNDNKHTYYYYVSLFFTTGMPVRAPFPQFPLPIGRVRT